MLRSTPQIQPKVEPPLLSMYVKILKNLDAVKQMQSLQVWKQTLFGRLKAL